MPQHGTGRSRIGSASRRSTCPGGPDQSFTIVWTDKTEYQQQLGEITEAQREKLHAPVGALRQRGLLTESEAAMVTGVVGQSIRKTKTFLLPTCSSRWLYMLLPIEEHCCSRQSACKAGRGVSSRLSGPVCRNQLLSAGISH